MIIKQSFMLVLLILLCQLVVSEKLELSATKLSAIVLVSAEKLDLKVEPGPREDYSSDKSFGLLIGGCDLSILAGSPDAGISFYCKVNGKAGETVKDLNGISATKGGLNLTGHESVGASLPIPLKCSAKFEPMGDKFTVWVKLSGGVPPNFKLISDAEVYDPEKEALKAKLMLLFYIGVPLLGLAIAMSVCAGIGFFFWRRKQKRLEDERLAAEKAAAEKAAAEKLAAEKLAAEKLAAEKVAAEKVAAEKLTAKNLAAVEKRAAEDLAAAQKLADEKLVATQERAAEELAAFKKQAAAKLADEKLTSKKLAEEKAEAEYLVCKFARQAAEDRVTARNLKHEKGRPRRTSHTSRDSAEP